MKRALMFLCIYSTAVANLFSQPSGPFVADSTTRALWHLDEQSGSIVNDASGNANNGVAIGTTIVPGRFGNARLFNGNGDYISAPPDSSLDFGNDSFTIEVWFKTTAIEGTLLRRGLAPAPGYDVRVHLGHIFCQLGDREDLPWPDTVYSIQGNALVNDGLWHYARMVRDREARKLSLYIDDTLAAPPIDDNLTFPITDDRPLMIGRWEDNGLPTYFNGTIDEVRLSSPKMLRPGLGIILKPAAVDFGWVRDRSEASVSLAISNPGFRDTLRIASIKSSSPYFVGPAGVLSVPPSGSISIMVNYTPITTEKDTGTLLVASNAPGTTVLSVPLAGRGYALMDNPIIGGAVMVPYTYYQIRLHWFRSLHDTAGNADPVVQYSLWRQVSGLPVASSRARRSSENLPSSTLIDPLWDFMETVPAMQFDQYSAVVQAIVNYSVPANPNIFMVAAHTKSLRVFMSASDTVAVDPPQLTSINEPGSTIHTFALEQNYPNPFNPSTTIRFGLPERSAVTLVVYNTLGQQVASLVNGAEESGYNEVRFDGTGLSSGMYFYRLHAGNFVQTKKFLLVR